METDTQSQRDSAPPKPAEQVSYRWLFWVLAILNLLATLWAVWDESHTRRPWKGYQERFNAVLTQKGLRTEPIEIRQVTNPELGIVDRCHTCHLGIDRPGFEGKDVPAVFRTHSQRKRLLGTNHPVAQTGCTICHQGQGSQIKGIAWYSFDHGDDDPYWEQPLLRGTFVQSSCVSCHKQETNINGAAVFNEGRRLFADRRCFGCHETPLYEPTFEAAPALEHVKTKLSFDFVKRWLTTPGPLRPNTAMPSFWPQPQLPDGKLVSEGSEPFEKWSALLAKEIKQIAAYLGSLEPRTPLADLELPDDLADAELIAEGKKQFDQVGCRGCHALARIDPKVIPSKDEDDDDDDDEGGGLDDDDDDEDEDGSDQPDGGKDGGAASPDAAPADGSAATDDAKQNEPTPEDPTRYGPDLSRIGERASARWLAAWLANPRTVWPKTRMPDMRLSEERRNALVAYLVSLRQAKSPPAEPVWPALDKKTIEAGRKAVQRYGCYGCHEIPSMGAVGKAGPDLDDFGDRIADRLAWGDAKPDCEETELQCWTLTKVGSPRWLSAENLPLVMPQMELTAAEVRALSVFVLGNRQRRIPAEYQPSLDESRHVTQRGEDLLAELNCRSCHEIGRQEKKIFDEDGELDEIRFTPNGGQIRRYYAQAAMAPPPLTFAGQKYQYPWLDGFLAKPTRVRPWLLARMPSFEMTQKQRASLIHYFAQRNKRPYPFSPNEKPELSGGDRKVARKMFKDFKCFQCHDISAAAGLQPGELAPDLSLSGQRLTTVWLRQWLLKPQYVQPNTKMPTFFPLEDDSDPKSITTPCPECFGGDIKRQIDALIAVNLEFAPGANLSWLRTKDEEKK